MHVFCGHVLFLLGKYLGVGLLGHSIDVCLSFLETAQQFSELVPLHSAASDT